MKKLGKLEISSKNIIKKEELINLKGGFWGSWSCYCWVPSGDHYDGLPWATYAESEADAMSRSESEIELAFSYPEHTVDCDACWGY
jgi:hypothetical protein